LLDARLHGHDNVMYMRIWLQKALAYLRQVSGDDAYERYLIHHCQHHADQTALDRRAFYLAEQQRKWNGIKRCC
jgi:uncharacterized short protein YbdD (DUF466 family)